MDDSDRQLLRFLLQWRDQACEQQSSMHRKEERSTAERALHERVKQEFARHQTLTQDCLKLFGLLKDAGSRHRLGTIRAIRENLRSSSADLLRALDAMSRLPLDGAATPKDARGSKGALNQEPAEFQTQLTARDKRIAELLNEGLRLAFRTEALEKEIARLGKIGGG